MQPLNITEHRPGTAHGVRLASDRLLWTAGSVSFRNTIDVSYVWLAVWASLRYRSCSARAPSAVRCNSI